MDTFYQWLFPVWVLSAALGFRALLFIFFFIGHDWSNPNETKDIRRLLNNCIIGIFTVLSTIMIVTPGAIAALSTLSYGNLILGFIVALPFIVWGITGEKDYPLRVGPDMFKPPVESGSLTPVQAVALFEMKLNLPEYIKAVIVKRYGEWASTLRYLMPSMVETQAYYTGKVIRRLPAYEIMQAGKKTISSIFVPVLKAMEHDDDELDKVINELHQLVGFREVLNQTEVGYFLPYRLRPEHHQIIAGSGHGKTQCIQSMIMEDWSQDISMVVIDSQGDLINNLLAHAPLDRVVLIDPETCPPSLNIFAMRIKGEKEIATAIELYEYIFSALDAGLTGKQSLVYRYLSRLLMEIPGATIETMRDLLKPSGTEPYQPFIDNLSGNARAFFEEFQREKNNQYSDTRQEVLRRLLTVLESETLSKMLSSPEMAYDFTELLDSGKIILINTAKGLLKDGSSLFGRIFIALVMQAVMGRKEERRRSYLYIDEFADYAEDSQVLFNLFEQSRKYELGLIVCHQYLSQLPERLRKSLSTNTAIKFAGGVSAEDARALANQMQTTPEAIQAQPALSFSAWLKGIGTVTWKVEGGRLEKTNKHDRQTLDDFRTEMIRLYGARKPLAPEPPMEREEPQDKW